MTRVELENRLARTDLTPAVQKLVLQAYEEGYEEGFTAAAIGATNIAVSRT